MQDRLRHLDADKVVEHRLAPRVPKAMRQSEYDTSVIESASQG
jgi:hypothetical protein